MNNNISQRGFLVIHHHQKINKKKKKKNPGQLVKNNVFCLFVIDDSNN